MNNNNSIRNTHLIPQDQYKQVNCWSSKLLQPVLFQSEESLAGLPFIAATCHVDCNYCVVATWIVVVYFDHLLLPLWNLTTCFFLCGLSLWNVTTCFHQGLCHLLPLLPPRDCFCCYQGELAALAATPWTSSATNFPHREL